MFYMAKNWIPAFRNGLVALLRVAGMTEKQTLPLAKGEDGRANYFKESVKIRPRYFADKSRKIKLRGFRNASCNPWLQLFVIK